MIPKDMRTALAVRVPTEEVSWKPQTFSGDKSRALMVAYVDARWVAERLDEATDGNWSFDFDVLMGDSEGVAIKGNLTVLTETRSDVGEYHRKGDRDDMEIFKAAVSDSLKRCALLFGVGRELYRGEPQWVKWDAAVRGPAAGEMERVKARFYPAPSWLEDEQALAAFLAWAASKYSYGPTEVLKALAVSKFPDFKGTKQDAVRMVGAWVPG